MRSITTTRSRFIQLIALVLALGLVVFVAVREPDFARIQVSSLSDLERELEGLRRRLRIPGMSAAIAEGDHVVWTRGFGMANLERGVIAGPNTIYHLASVTKPFASTVLLQLVDEGRLDLNAPISDFGLPMARSTPVRVWHLLSHTSGEKPGTTYRYDGNVFGNLTEVIERATGRAFARELTDRIIRPLGLTHTAPNPGDPHGVSSFVVSLSVSPEDVERARAIFGLSGLERGPIEAGLAMGYARRWGRSIWPTGLFGAMRPMSHGFTLSTTSGLVASAPDVARFSIALDQGRLLKASTRQRAWTPVTTPEGKTLPYGLGWFVQQSQQISLVWHYGHGFEASSLLVKLPDHRVTFVILANSDGLSRWRRLGDDANLLASPAAVLFLNWYSGRQRQ
ncbi:MAG: serine hydrolase domain-containing protein [Vicinamibacterales bacterium]